MSITKKQRRLIEEVNHLIGVLKVSPDVSQIKPDLRTTHLELAQRRLVISGVLGRYLLMDELLTDVICREFFDTRGRGYIKLWRTKKFRAFNYHVLERLYLLQKAEFVRARIRMPSQVHSDILALNELRNALAHSFFPENRRVKPRWKGVNIFSKAGFDQFWDNYPRTLEHWRLGPRLGFWWCQWLCLVATHHFADWCRQPAAPTPWMTRP